MKRWRLAVWVAVAAATGAATAAQLPSTGGSAEAFTLRTSDTVVEGIARDPRDGSVLLASLHNARIVRRHPDGRETVHHMPAALEVTGLLGLRVDAARNRIWACASLGPRWQAALLRLEGRTLRPEAVHRLPGTRSDHMCNDVAILADGTPVFTDSVGGGVWRVHGRAEPITPARALVHPNGISTLGAGLYVADACGVHRVAMRDGKTTMLETLGEQLGRIDGLYQWGGELVGIQNGARPSRIVAFRPTATGAAVVRTVISGDDWARLPTTGAVVGDRLLYVDDAQLGLIERGRLKPGTTVRPTSVREVGLGRTQAVAAPVLISRPSAAPAQRPSS